MTWQDALRLDPEAQQDWMAFLGKRMVEAGDEVERLVKAGNLQGAACAVGKKDAYTDIFAAFEVEVREAAAYATYRRDAGLDH